MTFEGLRCPLPPLSAAAVAALDRAVGEYCRKARAESAAMDGPACKLMQAVQHAVADKWGPFARVACFGSRATGLACATSDMDLVVTGVPGLDPACAGQQWQQAQAPPPTMADQCAALEDLRPHILALPGVSAAVINRSAVPVLAITADVPSALSAEAGGSSAGGSSAGGPIEGAAAAAAATEGATTTTTTTTLNLDISIHTAKHGGLRAAEHVRWLHANLPPLAPLVVVLKALLHRHGLKTVFTGGLSSYALVIMVARFLIDRPLLRYRRWDTTAQVPAHTAPPIEPTATANATAGAPDDGLGPVPSAASAELLANVLAFFDPPASLGVLLVEVLAFYGHIFDPRVHALLGSTLLGVPPLAGHGFADRSQLSAILSPPLQGGPESRAAHASGAPGSGAPGSGVPDAATAFAMHPLVVVDPVNVANNAGRACYRIAGVRHLFATASREVASTAESFARQLASSGCQRADGTHGAAEAATDAGSLAREQRAAVRALVESLLRPPSTRPTAEEALPPRGSVA